MFFFLFFFFLFLTWECMRMLNHVRFEQKHEYFDHSWRISKSVDMTVWLLVKRANEWLMYMISSRMKSR